MPLIASIICMASGKKENFRDTATFVVSIATFWLVIRAMNQGAYVTEPIEFAYSIIAFRVEPLGVIFATLASGLWVITHVYTVGYMRANNEKNQNRFYACFAAAISATIGIAFADSLITLFIFYELLTIVTYPLVVHAQTPEAKKSGRIYLAIVMGASVIFFLPAIAWTFTITKGNLDFVNGGTLNNFSGISVLFALYVAGIAKSAIMPLHRWLPAAMIAPTPVSALLHAVAVVKAGVFAILKITIYVFGIENIAQSYAALGLTIIASVSIIVASIVAMTKDDLKARLAYSTVSQLAYVTLGIATAGAIGIIGATLHIITHAMGKITLFMCAGNIYTTTQKKKISEMERIGHIVPITLIAFGIGAFSIIGLPPLAGAWSKWILMDAAAEIKHYVIIAVLIISTLLNIVYLTPVFAKPLFKEKMENDDRKIENTPILCIIPPCLTAIGCLLIFIFANDITEYIAPVAYGYS